MDNKSKMIHELGRLSKSQRNHELIEQMLIHYGVHGTADLSEEQVAEYLKKITDDEDRNRMKIIEDDKNINKMMLPSQYHEDNSRIHHWGLDIIDN